MLPRLFTCGIVAFPKEREVGSVVFSTAGNEMKDRVLRRSETWLARRAARPTFGDLANPKL